MPNFFRKPPPNIPPFDDKAWDEFFANWHREMYFPGIFNLSDDGSDYDERLNRDEFQEDCEVEHNQRISEIIKKANIMFKMNPSPNSKERMELNGLISRCNNILNGR